MMQGFPLLKPYVGSLSPEQLLSRDLLKRHAFLCPASLSRFPRSVYVLGTSARERETPGKEATRRAALGSTRLRACTRCTWGLGSLFLLILASAAFVFHLIDLRIVVVLLEESSDAFDVRVVRRVVRQAEGDLGFFGARKM